MLLPRTARQALIAPVLATLVGCDEAPSPPPDPGPNPAAMVLDGVPILRADIEALLPGLMRGSSSTGRNTAIRYLLDRHLVPLAFARRELAAPRAEQRRRAGVLAKALGESAGVEELRSRAAKIPGFEVLTDRLRPSLSIPEQLWLFEDENVGRVSPVLETAQGFSLVACVEKRAGVTKAFDRVDAVVIRFYTMSAAAFSSWSQRLRIRLGSLPPGAIDLDPDFEDALPQWPRLPAGEVPKDGSEKRR